MSETLDTAVKPALPELALTDDATFGGITRQATGVYAVSATTGIFGARGPWAVTAP